MSTCYLVLGTPRSGTTLTASILHALGVNMGDSWVPGLPGWGPSHFFADAEFHPLLRMLREDELAFPEAPNTAILRDLAALIWDRNARYARWGVKDFGLPFCVPAIRPYFDALQIIHCTRPLMASAASWIARQSWHRPDEAEAIITSHDTAIRALLPILPHPPLVVPFDALTEASEQTIQRIATFVGLPVTADALALPDPSWVRF